LDRAGRSIDGFALQVRLQIDADDLDQSAWRQRAEAYAEAGVTDLVLAPQTREKDVHRRWLATLLSVLTDAT
jgi:hypothetical protein